MTVFLEILPRFLIALILTVVVIFINARSKRAGLILCGIMVGVSGVAGLAMYTWVFMPSDASFAEMLIATIRGLFSTFQMFMLADNHWAFAENPETAHLTENLGWQLMFWGVHILAAFVTISAIMAVFGRKLTDRVRIFINRYISKKHYVIIGCDDYMKMFLDNLTGENESDDEEKNTIHGNRRETKEKPKEKCISKGKITIITDTDDESAYETFVEKGLTVLNEEIDEKTLKKVGACNPFRNTKVIAMSKNEAHNLDVGSIIAKCIAEASADRSKIAKWIAKVSTDGSRITKWIAKAIGHTWSRIAKWIAKASADGCIIAKCIAKALANKRKIKLKAYIMYTKLEMAEHLEFVKQAKGRIHFFNPYDIRVRMFFDKHPVTSLIPKDWIDTKTARLKGKYDGGLITKDSGKCYRILNIFVGFGDTNAQMLNGSILTGQMLGCNYNAVIYDTKAKAKEARFKNYSSGLFWDDSSYNNNDEKYFKWQNEKYNIDFREFDVYSIDFYKDLIEEVGKSDMTTVFVALDSDVGCYGVACEIRQYLYEHKKVSTENVRIYARVCEKLHYADSADDKKDPKSIIEVECFGENSSILTKEHIINERADIFAQQITNKNRKHRQGDDSAKDKSSTDEWGEITEFERASNRSKVLSIRVFLNLIGLDLEYEKPNQKGVDEKEYIEKYYLGYSKSVDTRKFIDLSIEIEKLRQSDDKENLAEKEAERKKLILEHVEKDENGKIKDSPRNNLARLEHLRWNTFHLLNGWSKMPKDDVTWKVRNDKKSKQHACITTFEDLIELRKLQAERAKDKEPEELKALLKERAESVTEDVLLKAGEEKRDVIWYDYNLMDELPARLAVTDPTRVIVSRSETENKVKKGEK